MIEINQKIKQKIKVTYLTDQIEILCVDNSCIVIQHIQNQYIDENQLISVATCYAGIDHHGAGQY